MKKFLFAVSAVMIISSACSQKSGIAGNNTADNVKDVVTDVLPQSDGGNAFIPKASAFKMSGPYADKVAVTLSPTGALSYFPAPSDISAASIPVYLGDGWWLNNQGISANSVFTSWTFEEYSRLSETPSPAEISAHIIPGAEITEFRKLDVPLYDAKTAIPAIRRQLGISN